MESVMCNIKLTFLDAFCQYINYCKSLKFDDEPNYEYLRGLFRSLFFYKGFSNDFVFDWNLLMFVS